MNGKEEGGGRVGVERAAVGDCSERNEVDRKWTVIPPSLAIVDLSGQYNISSSASSVGLSLAVHRLMSSCTFVLIVNSLDYDVSRFLLGHDMRAKYSSPQTIQAPVQGAAENTYE
jgi:hypothetical protein